MFIYIYICIQLNDAKRGLEQAWLSCRSINISLKNVPSDALSAFRQAHMTTYSDPTLGNSAGNDNSGYSREELSRLKEERDERVKHEKQQKPNKKRKRSLKDVYGLNKMKQRKFTSKWNEKSEQRFAQLNGY